MTKSEWTVEQAAELLLEHVLTLLDGCDDEDTVRVAIVLEAVQTAWAPESEVRLPEGLTAGELRRRLVAARRMLATGEKVP